jgi:cell wall-associated NlpC family hydrolase
VTGRAATGGPVRGRARGCSTSGWAPIVVVIAALAAGLLLAVGPAAGQTITSKREQAQAILLEVEQLGRDVEQAAEAWNYAKLELDRIDVDLEKNARHLVAAKRSLGIAQTRIEKRLRDLYVNGSGDSTLEVLLGASSLDDIITRLDAIERVSKQDARVLAEVKRYRKEVETRRAQLKQARTDQAQLVAERAALRSSIESRLGEQQQLLASVKDEIVQLQAEERARQAQLAAEARLRLQAQQAAALQTANETVSAGYGYDAVIPAAPPPDGTASSQVVAIALQYLGVPYVWGGASPSTGFDCSGFTMYVYAQIGINLPHHAASQYNYGVPVSREDLAPGDLVFFDGLGHMGMYIGSDQFVHAPHSGDVVKISSLYDGWYSSTWVGARRIL